MDIAPIPTALGRVIINSWGNKPVVIQKVLGLLGNNTIFNGSITSIKQSSRLLTGSYPSITASGGYLVSVEVAMETTPPAAASELFIFLGAEL